MIKAQEEESERLRMEVAECRTLYHVCSHKQFFLMRHFYGIIDIINVNRDAFASGWQNLHNQMYFSGKVDSHLHLSTSILIL